MSEIEKMYKTIFGEFEPNCSLCVKLVDCKIFNNTRNCNKFECDYKSLFTAEKQIAILQFCLKWGQVHILKGIDNEYRIENSCYRQGYQPTIADAIANYINEKWEKLTPEEKQQIKEILE